MNKSVKSIRKGSFMLSRWALNLSLGLALLCAIAFCVQAQNADQAQAQTTVITASLTDDGIRFVAPAGVARMRLEAFTAAGEKVFDSGFKPGNALDWPLQYQHGQRLADGYYRCVITARDLAGRLTEKQGEVSLHAGAATLRQPDNETESVQLAGATNLVNRESLLAILREGATRATTVLIHDGDHGRVVSGSGGLSFDLGDFFTGKDAERMRLTPEGNLGIGIANPQARLDVAGLIRTSEGIVFPDGTIQTTAANALKRGDGGSESGKRGTDGSESKAVPIANINGVGTTNQVTKWINGPAGVVGDSAIAEVGGRVGIGATSSLISRLQVESNNTTTTLYSISAAIGGTAVFGDATAAGSGGAGVRGYGSAGDGVRGQSNSGTGVSGFSSSGAGVRGQSLSGEAGRFEGKVIVNGNVGIGVASPISKLAVAGVIETTSGGVKFPDGTIQTSRGLTSVSTTCCTLNGNGTSSSPLSVHVPLTLESAAIHSTIAGTNTNANAASRGLYGQASGGIGVHGIHAAIGGNAPGVKGETNSTSFNAVGVLGVSGKGSGVIGLSNGGIGIDIPTTWAGVVGRNPVGIAVLGEGGTYGVYGSNSETGLEGAGVAGFSRSKMGVKGSSASGNGVFASSHGQARNAAALRADNGNTDRGMAAYMTNSSNFATAHFANSGGGEVLYLQANGGPFIRAMNNDESKTVFSVNYDGTTVTNVLQILGGADFAEQFEVNEAPKTELSLPIQPGQVVSIDPANPGKLVVSSRAYDRRVAGIISGAGGVKPGMMMGQVGSIADGNHPVALSGRVYCWADASNGPIEPGDLLTTANAPGHAMKATDYAKAQGAIIGKAMSSLKEGKGLVLILVSLQ